VVIWKAFSGVLKGNGCLHGCVWWKRSEICAVLGYYAAKRGNPLPTFQHHPLVSSSQVRKSKKKRTLEEGTNKLPPTSIRNYHSVLCNIPEEHRSHLHCSVSLKSHVEMFCVWTILLLICRITFLRN